MKLYHFLDAKYGLDDIKKRRLKIAIIEQLNDPFEFMGVDLTDVIFRKALERTKAELSKKKGILCFCKGWSNPVMWSHYADRHRGLCLAFEFPECEPTRVHYLIDRMPRPDTPYEEFMGKLLFSKFQHWEYEEEYRIFHDLESSEDGLYFAAFGNNLILRQVIIGSESTITPTELSDALGPLKSSVQIIVARPDFKQFKVVRNNDFNLFK